MDFLVVATLLFILALSLICVLTTLGVMRVARRAKRSAIRTRIRLADTLPAATFGNQLWWQATRIDRAFEKAEYAERATAGSAFAEDVVSLSTQLEAGGQQLRARLKSISALSGRERARELQRLESQILELEAGAASLVSLADRIEQMDLHPDVPTAAGKNVERRAEAIRHAIDELEAIEAEVSGPVPAAGLFDADDLDAGAGLVARVERDEQRRERLERRRVEESPGVDGA